MEYIYLIRLKIKQKNLLPKHNVVDIDACFVDLYFKDIPTYRRIRDAFQEEQNDWLEGMDSDEKPEFYKFNKIGDVEIVMARSILFEV